jgi:cell division protein ZapA
MSNKSNQVDVVLLNKKHQLACPEGQEDTLLLAVDLLNQKVDEMKQRSNVRSDQNALLLAALHLCYDLQAEHTKTNNIATQQQALIDKLSVYFAKNETV